MISDDSEYHPAIVGSDLTDLQAGFFSRMGDAVTKGAPAAAISGALSIANTVLDYTPGAELIDVQNAITKYDEDVGSYYRDNKENADLVGFVAPDDGGTRPENRALVSGLRCASCVCFNGVDGGAFGTLER